LTFFQRIKTPFTDSAADERAQYQPRMWMVGEVLQERRQELGLELDEIGAMLRIKPAYLAALEQGRSADLPGPTYAIGFVRAYAEFLGLESEPVLARFKAEVAGVTARPDLALPVPLGERSLPGGALVLVALIVALCGYGIWYYISTEERSRPDRVAAVPASLQATPPASTLVAPPQRQASTPPNSDSTPSLSQGSPSAPAPSLFGAAAGSTPPAETPSPGPAPLPSPAAPSPAPAMPPAASVPAAAPAPAQAPSAPGPALSQGALLTTMPRGSSSTAPPPTPAPAPAASPQPAAPSQPVATPQPPPTQTAAATPASAPAASAGAVPGRVTIRALADCWIQVKGSDQTIVFSRVLKSGEVYAVPSKPGLSLRTGNAGALEIAIDGKTAPSIGGIGTLRRDVELDPAELEAGTAVHG
jgi:cytoskeletal protein RodZ